MRAHPAAMSETKKFKDEISPATNAQFGQRLQAALPGFDGDAFIRDADADLDALALKARLKHVARAAVLHWPGPIGELIGVLPDVASRAPAMGGFSVWPMLQIIEDYGLPARNESLAAMVALTPMWSAEFAIRPFLEADQTATLTLLTQWAASPDEHVRRLVSEGSRPRLPWGRQLRRFVADPSHTLPLLELLRTDPSLYVRRSVANHLNDIAKDHPDRVVEVLQRWQREVPSPEMTWICRHATRTLVKNGHRGALALRGFGPPSLVVESFAAAPKTLQFPGQLALETRLRATAPTAQHWAVDFVVHHVRQNGARTQKVFKWREVRAAPGAVVRLDKRHMFKAISTRRYYPGLHRVELQINGAVFAGADFTLNIPDHNDD
ncbi:MAG: DNA alkylation repair protein [Myxococcales bacterium]|nr:DNA alkylation repair protein [Myxococcales bacterium]